MECISCGRTKRIFETFSKYGLCPQCNELLHTQVKSGLSFVRQTAELCRLRLQGAPVSCGDQELLSTVQRALATLEELEDLREEAPFFKSSLEEETGLLGSFCTKIREGSLPALDSSAFFEGDTLFLSQLFSLPNRTIVPAELDEPPKCVRRKPSGMDRLVLQRIAPASSPDRFGSYTALDVKTTGSNPKRHEILSVSAVRFQDFAPVELWASLLLPSQPLTPDIQRACGITNDMVRGMPLLQEVLPSLEEFLRGQDLVGYRLASDLSFLDAFGLNVLAGQRRCFDVQELAEAFFSSPSSTGEPLPPEDRSLTSLCQWADVHREETFRLGADSLSIGLLFSRLVHRRTTRH